MSFIEDAKKAIENNKLESYKKRVSKMSDRKFLDEYYKYRKHKSNSKEYEILGAELMKRRIEGGHSEEIFTLEKKSGFNTLGEQIKDIVSKDKKKNTTSWKGKGR